MLQYDISEYSRKVLKKYPQATLLALIQTIKQDSAVINEFEITGLIKAEGGVKVNGKPIVIMRDYVKHDYIRSEQPMTEEYIVALAIQRLANRIDQYGICFIYPYISMLLENYNGYGYELVEMTHYKKTYYNDFVFKIKSAYHYLLNVWYSAKLYLSSSNGHDIY